MTSSPNDLASAWGELFERVETYVGTCREAGCDDLTIVEFIIAHGIEAHPDEPMNTLLSALKVLGYLQMYPAST